MPPLFARFCCSLALTAIVAVGVMPMAAHAGDTDKQTATKAKLAKVKQHIAALARTVRKTSGQRHVINTTLATQADKLAAAVKAVHASDKAMATNQQQLDALQKQRDGLEKNLAGQREALADLLRAAYKIQPGSDLRLLLGHADMTRLARALAYSRYFQHDRIEHIQRLITQLDQLQQVKLDITQKRTALEVARTQKQQHMASLKKAREQQQALLAKINTQLKQQHRQLAQLKRNRQSLTQLLAQLRDVFADIPDKLPDNTPFAERRGKLPWPVLGKPHRHGEGLDISARRGATVHAVAHGRVAYADWLRGYGLLIVIDHGHGWMSMYGDNESLKVGVGDWVRAGQPIATAGAGASTDAGVYFGLRHDGKPVRPLKWLVKHP